MFSARALRPLSSGHRLTQKTRLSLRYVHKPFSTNHAIHANEHDKAEITEQKTGGEKGGFGHNINIPNQRIIASIVKEQGFPDNTSIELRKRKWKWAASYSKMTIQDAERKLKIRIKNIRNVSVAGMISEATTTLGDARIDKKTIDDLKEEVYYHILQYLNIEGYPTEASADYKEANVSDLVLYVIGPIIARMNEVGRKTRLSRERAIFAEDSSIGGIEEFVVVDEVAVTEEKSVLIIEAKRHAIGHAMIQILLAMKDAQENNLGGIVYGFVTTGEDWRMLTYDGGEFVMTNKIVVLFNTMKEEKEKWLQENAIIVDCMLIALTNGESS